MTDSLIFSVNAILPIFLLVLFGGVIRKSGWLPESFFKQANQFVFHVTLPVTLFCDVMESAALSLDGRLTLYCVAFLGLELLTLLLLVPVFVKNNASRGALIQGAYRSNVAIIGVPLIASLFGESGSAQMATVMPIMVVLYNALAVVILSFFAPDSKKETPRALVQKILKTVLLNPLIIGILLGLAASFLPFSLPVLITKPLQYLDGLTMPLSLMSLGASFYFDQLKGRLGLASVASALRCIVFPLLALVFAVLLGFRGASLGVILVVFGSSTAISSYVVSERMGSDSVLAGQIILFSTLLSVLTLFAGTALLRYFSFF